MSEKIPNYNYDADEVLNDFKSKFAWPKRDEVLYYLSKSAVVLLHTRW